MKTKTENATATIRMDEDRSLDLCEYLSDAVKAALDEADYDEADKALSLLRDMKFD